MTEPQPQDLERDAELEAFWADARTRGNTNRLEALVGANPRGSVRPPAWSFAADAATADLMLEQLLDGSRTAVTSLELADDGDAVVPEPGDLAIVLDGEGHPRALVRTVRVVTVRYADVDEATARADGAADVEQWRRDNAAVLASALGPGEEIGDDSLVVVEHLQRVYPARPRRSGGDG
ncbi:protein of unknown function DUF437 [Beutenbergia cavernae DSM 12333]|uniref:ASCH domain-containing protein n=1 Tax=Beutenbergia cavernae (strain ATCC BAA-8 / DSM 12333 / CCUG 43141 / JCM 11478 / NBRC 16432 / NCIMB 13614 / HKI 0122) TaxID=471853 RepID=C5C2I7_BEUC1|nr:ASCH domain-containing protein [Beutenbergia cavernae]ACQ79673.1 protein of unknown function DUF437 [Beutenbergia cavernae DSM 12333]